ncbi:MAG: hypothetical protein JJ974_04170 [Phycisphaerales bacterium]|nr:hypothetical protein [Phycisphaerales bacterium]
MNEHRTDDSHANAHTQTNLTCTKCDYLLDGLNLREHCPECGTKIVNECFWCDYDLSNTAPDSKCPECGVPVTASIGSGILATVPTEILQRLHSGMRIVTTLILIYIISVVLSIFMTFVFTPTMNATTLTMVDVVSSIINNSIFLGIIYGWWKVSTPIPQIPPQLNANSKRTFLRILSTISVIVIILGMFIGIFSSSIVSAATYNAVVLYSLLFLSLSSNIVMIIYFIASVMYTGWIARLVRNTKMYRRSKHLVWSGPLIAILGFVLLFLGPLIVLILYWNMIEYTRRDLKKIINTAHRNRLVHS